MASRTQDPLALATKQTLPFVGTVSPFVAGRALSHEERRVQIARDMGFTTIDATSQLGTFAVTTLNALNTHTFIEFARASEDIFAVRDTARGSDAQLYLEAFAKQLITRMAHHDLGIVEVAAHGIAQELQRGAHPVSEPEPPSLIDRLFGRRR